VLFVPRDELVYSFTDGTAQLVATQLGDVRSIHVDVFGIAIISLSIKCGVARQLGSIESLDSVGLGR